MKLRDLVTVSRPRFWLYLTGPFLIGIASNPSPTLFNIVGIVYFLFPANLYLYGINDLSDRDTDALNPKKLSKEHRLNKSETTYLSFAVIFSILLSIPLFVMGNTISRAALTLFFILGYIYSAAPLRLKSRPFVDSASNLLYILPGVVSYSLNTGLLPNISFLIAGSCWAAAMHLFSAIPDKEVDTKAKLKTTAVVLGVQKSLILCSFLWVASTLLVTLYHPIGLVGLIYCVIPLFLLNKSQEVIMNYYWKFPLINGVIGFLLFLTVYFLRK